MKIDIKWEWNGKLYAYIFLTILSQNVVTIPKIEPVCLAGSALPKYSHKIESIYII